MVQFIDSTVEFVIVERTTLEERPDALRATWAVPGAYVLIGRPVNPQAGARVRARPGLAGQSLIRRVDAHLVDEQMAWFDRAVLIRDTRGFNSAQAGFVEGALHDLCRSAPAVEHDYRRDGDNSLKPHEEEDLRERYVRLASAVLRLVGVPVEVVVPAPHRPDATQETR